MTKFSDMPTGKVKRWIAWAQSHDWGVSGYYSAGQIRNCKDWYSVNGKAFEATPKAFDNPRDMRNWEGY